MKSLIFIYFLTFLYGQSVPFKVGETLTYKAFFTGIEAGIGQLRVISLDSLGDKLAYQIRFSAQTKGFVDFLFSIDDNIDIWLDHKSLSTLKVNKKVREGKYKKDSKRVFLEDMFSFPHGYLNTDLQFDLNEVLYTDNTEDEIRDAVIEILNIFENNNKDSVNEKKI